ncbi:jg8371 [Pararge aegeria aegeria]|uniref:Jg8371 protein n=1 Tax=Pararge aegeria aegeria TaxID=348720 RepID=A0A8S4SGW4_9NEOP|nr:jg8371 [Pararge aegeria aegeria]
MDVFNSQTQGLPCACAHRRRQIVTYVTSRRGKKLLSINGFTFCVQSTSGHKTRWICSTHNHKQCRAVVHTVEGQILKLNNNHNHQSSSNYYSVIMYQQ